MKCYNCKWSSPHIIRERIEEQVVERPSLNYVNCDWCKYNDVPPHIAWLANDRTGAGHVQTYAGNAYRCKLYEE